jgi:adenylosuccinate lyase
MVCATLARIGGEVYELSRPEIAELRESLRQGGVSSITMPHKRNPEGSEHLVTLWRLVRAHAGVLLEGMDQQHERDGRGWKAEWVSLPEVCEFAVTALDVAHGVVDGLEVDSAAMARNLAAGGDNLHSEQILASLSELRGKHAAQALMAEVVGSGSVGAQGLAAAVAARAGLEPDRVAAWAARPGTGAAAAMVDLVLDHAAAARRVGALAGEAAS